MVNNHVKKELIKKIRERMIGVQGNKGEKRKFFYTGGEKGLKHQRKTKNGKRKMIQW